MTNQQPLLPLNLPPPISGRQYALLRSIAADYVKLGRMRTSSEACAGPQERASLLHRLQELEEKGVICRTGKSWRTGSITESGYQVLRHGAASIRHRSNQNFPQGIGKNGGTRFSQRVFPAQEMNVLASGDRNAKLGGRVLKGRHKGLPMHTVTLEEGRTCALECTLRDRCYGGGMPRAKRVLWEGEQTSDAVAQAIIAKPGVMLRLHTLGDFPSVNYAERVFEAVMNSGGSAAFGFTHYQRETPIGKRVANLAEANWERFAIRTSYEHGKREPIPERSAVIISHPDQAREHNAVWCPEQQGKTKSCSTCGYCWHSQRPVAFLLHSQISKFLPMTE